ncbi:hypothetical protein SARC_17698, partial [Sphaeroforma arctica JP610]
MCITCSSVVIFGRKCRYCRDVVHKGCRADAPPTCGLPRKYLEYFTELITFPNDHTPRTLVLGTGG